MYTVKADRASLGSTRSGETHVHQEGTLTHAVRRDTRGHAASRCKMLTESVIAITATAARLALVKHRHMVALPAQLDPARRVVLACQHESISDGKGDTRQRVSGAPDAVLHPASA